MKLEFCERIEENYRETGQVERAEAQIKKDIFVSWSSENNWSIVWYCPIKFTPAVFIILVCTYLGDCTLWQNCKNRSYLNCFKKFRQYFKFQLLFLRAVVDLHLFWILLFRIGFGFHKYPHFFEILSQSDIVTISMT